MFIATANVAETIPGPLLDRMEVIRFDGYTVAEKTAIARGYLWPRQIERNGLRTEEVEVTDADHTGLNDVKDRIVEYLAVRKLRAERGFDRSDDDAPAPTLSTSSSMITGLLVPASRSARTRRPGSAPM